MIKYEEGLKALNQEDQKYLDETIKAINESFEKMKNEVMSEIEKEKKEGATAHFLSLLPANNAHSTISHCMLASFLNENFKEVVVRIEDEGSSPSKAAYGLSEKARIYYTIKS